MRIRSLILYSVLVVAISLLLFVTAASRAVACSCVLPTVESSYKQSSDVAFVDLTRTYVSGDTRYYLGRVVRTFKGCLRTKQSVILKTPLSGAACGTELLLRRYLIHGTAAGSENGATVLSISLCNYDRQVSVLSARDLEYLEARLDECDTIPDGFQLRGLIHDVHGGGHLAAVVQPSGDSQFSPLVVSQVEVRESV